MDRKTEKQYYRTLPFVTSYRCHTTETWIVFKTTLCFVASFRSILAATDFDVLARWEVSPDNWKKKYFEIFFSGADGFIVYLFELFHIRFWYCVCIKGSIESEVEAAGLQATSWPTPIPQLEVQFLRPWIRDVTGKLLVLRLVKKTRVQTHQPLHLVSMIKEVDRRKHVVFIVILEDRP